MSSSSTSRGGLLLTSPYLIFFSLFIAYPLIFGVGLVFYRWDMIQDPEFVGIDNFKFLVQDTVFWQALWNTVKFLVVHVSFQMVAALGIAILLNKKIKFQGLFRTIFFLPVVVSGVVVTILWKQLYDTDAGVLNQLAGYLDMGSIPWLTDPLLAMPSIALMATWKNMGFYIILFLAGLQSVPPTLYEAADVEGATAGEKFRTITLPMLSPVIFLVLILSTINGFKLFVEPYVMTGGGPNNSTISMVHYLYKQAFEYQHMGYSATIGFMLALLILGVVMLQRRYLDRDYIGFGWMPSGAGLGRLTGGRQISKPVRKFAVYATLCTAGIIFAYPFAWMIMASFRGPKNALDPSLFAGDLSLDNYRQIVTAVPLVRTFFNSLAVASVITASVLVFGSMVGYALARLHFKGKKVINLVVLLTLVVPAELLLIPLYSLVTKIGWSDSYEALILPFALNAMAIIMFKQFFQKVPEELAEAARVEGCSEFQILFKIFFPISKPIFVTVGIITFVGAWNEVLWPLIVNKSPDMMTLPQAITLYAVGRGPGEIGAQLAGSLVLSLPVVLAYLFFQKHFVSAMATSGLKG
jgi:multiple sugar transport system permease protein